jgi:hypothetical protein
LFEQAVAGIRFAGSVEAAVRYGVEHEFSSEYINPGLRSETWGQDDNTSISVMVEASGFSSCIRAVVVSELEM